MYGTAAQEAIMDYWVNEKDCPYAEIKPFTWWRSYQLGGRSLLWQNQYACFNDKSPDSYLSVESKKIIAYMKENGN